MKEDEVRKKKGENTMIWNNLSFKKEMSSHSEIVNRKSLFDQFQNESESSGSVYNEPIIRVFSDASDCEENKSQQEDTNFLGV